MNEEMQNYCFPKGRLGKKIVKSMNEGHADLSEWVFSLITTAPDMTVLDTGCGGGGNVQRFCQRCPEGFVYGLDYSPVSVEHSRKVNRKSIDNLCCRIIQGDVTALPFSGSMFDMITAFETIYFWPDLEKAFANIAKCLKPEGCFVIAQTTDGTLESDKEHMEMIKGMKVYSMEDLLPVLEKSGFRQVEFHTNEQKYLCLECRK